MRTLGAHCPACDIGSRLKGSRKPYPADGPGWRHTHHQQASGVSDSETQIPFLLTSAHFFISSPAGGVPSTVLLPTSPQFVLNTVPPLSTKDLFCQTTVPKQNQLFAGLPFKMYSQVRDTDAQIFLHSVPLTIALRISGSPRP